MKERIWGLIAVSIILMSACSGDKGARDKVDGGGAADAGGMDDVGDDASGKVDGGMVENNGTLGVPWVDVSPQRKFPGISVYDAMAFDDARGEALLVSDSGTYAWREDRWFRVAEPPGGVPREGHAMAYHAATEEVVLFGGRVGLDERDDTWTWDGEGWLERDVTGPAATYFHGMAYDTARERTVLYGGGGYDGDAIYGDTWEWDGASWQQVTTTDSPGTRSSLGLAYDAARRVIVLYGGTRSGGFLGDVWEYDGANWVDVTPGEGGPPERIFNAFVYDATRRASLLIGGERANNFFDDTWAWDGTEWTDLTLEVGALPARWAHAAAYHPATQQVVLYGGIGPEGELLNRHFGETRALPSDGAWGDISPDVTAPPSIRDATATYDSARGELVLFGGVATSSVSDATWLWNGVRWRKAEPDVSPPGRFDAVAAFDEERQEVVLFGGAGNVPKGDTWTWDGESWAEAATVDEGPGGRSASVAAWDPKSRRVLLYGGIGTTMTAHRELWAWDGTAWELLDDSGLTATPHTPLFMLHHADRSSTLIITVHRDAQGVALTGAFEWTGTGWSQLATTNQTDPLRIETSGFYDPARRSVVLFGGRNDGNDALGDTWELAGDTWRELTPATSPAPRMQHAIAYDSLRRRGVLFGGTPGETRETWEWNGAVAGP